MIRAGRLNLGWIEEWSGMGDPALGRRELDHKVVVQHKVACREPRDRGLAAARVAEEEVAAAVAHDPGRVEQHPTGLENHQGIDDAQEVLDVFRGSRRAEQETSSTRGEIDRSAITSGSEQDP